MMKSGSNKDKKNNLQREIDSCEKQVNFYRERFEHYKKKNWHWMLDDALKAMNHFDSRRRFFIRKLIEAQLKEFDRG